MRTMRRIPSFLGFLACVWLVACASYQVVKLPLREADLYPNSETRADITVAVDEISDPLRVEKFFGVDLLKEGILPIDVIVSNHGEHKVVVKPADVLLSRGKAIIDPMPVEIVTDVIKNRFRFDSSERKQIDAYFTSLSLQDEILVPHDSYHGVLFFQLKNREQRDDWFFRVLRLYRGGNLKLSVVLTNLGTDERVHFGPFPLST